LDYVIGVYLDNNEPFLKDPHMPISPLLNQPAPSFSLDGSDDKKHSLKDFRGQWLIMYFYPKDNTPGCTQESCDFRDQQKPFASLNATIVGISKDSLPSHQKFINEHHLNFTLLSDPTGSVHEAYHAWGEKNMYGKKTIGCIRSTFIINPQGVIAAAWHNVKVPSHVDTVQKTLTSLQTTP
jgi:peroxiredoxin Q/BCP